MACAGGFPLLPVVPVPPHPGGCRWGCSGPMGSVPGWVFLLMWVVPGDPGVKLAFVRLGAHSSCPGWVRCLVLPSGWLRRSGCPPWLLRSSPRLVCPDSGLPLADLWAVWVLSKVLGSMWTLPVLPVSVERVGAILSIRSSSDLLYP